MYSSACPVDVDISSAIYYTQCLHCTLWQIDSHYLKHLSIHQYESLTCQVLSGHPNPWVLVKIWEQEAQDVSWSESYGVVFSFSLNNVKIRNDRDNQVGQNRKKGKKVLQMS